jgi:hypothetical protein
MRNAALSCGRVALQAYTASAGTWSSRMAWVPRVTLTVTQSGLWATVARLYVGSISRRNVRLEAEGLKRRCEGRVESGSLSSRR